jgi:hypothetical protein
MSNDEQHRDQVAGNQDILDRIKRLQFEGIPARLSMALEPFGLAVEIRKTSNKMGSADLRLIGRDPKRQLGERAGFAAWHELDLIFIGIDETDRIWLRKPIDLTFKRASAAQIYERINDVIMKRLRPGKARARQARAGAKFREMLCIQPSHNEPITRHSFQKTKIGTETWRCEVCKHSTVIPRPI